MAISNSSQVLTPTQGNTQPALEDLATQAMAGADRARNSEPDPEFTPEVQNANQYKDPLKDINGAPTLPRPTLLFGQEDLIAALQSLREQSLTGQEANARGQLEKSRIDSKKANESQQAKLKEWAADCEKAANAERRAKIFGWVGKIVAAAAAIATVLTVGTAAPLLLAVACIGFASAALALVDQGAKDFGSNEKGLSLGSLFSTVAEWMLRAVVKDEEKAAQIGMLAGGVIGSLAFFGIPLLVEPQLLGEMAKSICELSGTSDETKMWVTMSVGLASTVTVGIIMAVAAWKLPLSESMSIITKAYTGAGVQLLQGATQIAQGSNTIARAIYDANASEKMSDKQLLDAMMTQFQRTMETSMDDLKKVIQQLQEAVESVSTMINSFSESATLINRNMSKSPV